MSQPKLSASGNKRKHATLTILQKVEIIKKLESGSSVQCLALSYGISARTIYDIKKNKEKILNFYIKSDSNAGIVNRKTIKSAKSEDLDNIIYEWFKQRRSDGIPISGPLLQAKARDLHQELKIKESYTFSTGWLASFKRRHGIRYLKASGEKLSADTQAAEDYIEELSAMIEEYNLSPEQIYNADESGLFWRCLPRQTLVTSEVTSVSGFKEVKDRVTIMVCSNAAGSHQCKLMVIGKLANPRAFKGVKQLPVLYKSNKKAWINKPLMIDWVENHFTKEARKHCNDVGLPSDCKILLLVDRCGAHPEIDEKNNVIVKFLPANTTSLIQPMDQGIINSLKCSHRQEFLRRLITFNLPRSEISEYRKLFTIKDCIFLIEESWRSVSKDTLINVWHNVWPESLFLDGESQKEFTGFHHSDAKSKAAELLEFAKASLDTVPDYMANLELVEEFLDFSNEPVEAPEVTDEEIIDSVLNPEKPDSESESEDEETKISYTEGLSSGYKYLSFIQQLDFVSDQEKMFVQQLQKKITVNMSKNLKQKKN